MQNCFQKKKTKTQKICVLKCQKLWKLGMQLAQVETELG